MTRRERMLDTASHELLMDVQSMSYLQGVRFAEELENLQLQSMAAGNTDISVRGITLTSGELANLRMEFRKILHDFEDSTAAELDAIDAAEPAPDDRQPWQREVERLSAELQQDPGNEDLYEDLKRWQAVGKNTAQLIQDHHQSKLDQESLNADNLIAQQIGLGDFDDAA